MVGRILLSWVLAGGAAIGWAADGSEFEAVSIKRLTPPPQNYPRPSCKDGRFLASATPAPLVVFWAYDTTYDLTSGWPKWTENEIYEIQAKSEKALSESECKRAVQGMLAQRFHLKAHREAKDTPVYFLTVVKKGAKVREIGATPSGSDGARINGTQIGGTTQRGIAMADLADILHRNTLVARPVIDKTGLKGTYSFRLEYAAKTGSDGPDLFTALPEQLGLKLEPGKAPVQILVVDGMERPSAN